MKKAPVLKYKKQPILWADAAPTRHAERGWAELEFPLFPRQVPLDSVRTAQPWFKITIVFGFIAYIPSICMLLCTYYVMHSMLSVVLHKLSDRSL